MGNTFQVNDMQRVHELPPLPDRPEDGHKGTFGRVLIVAGSRGMSGAAILSGTAALRSGAGLVYVAAPEGIVPIIAGYEPSYLTIPLAEDESGRIAESSLNELAERIKAMDAVAMGPGLGQSDGLERIVKDIYEQTSQPMVVDADALNLLSRSCDQLSSHAGPRVLTPHPGEFARLTGKAITGDSSEREQAALQFAAVHQLVLVLKGPGTIITDGVRLAVNTTGNSGMATGGTGDVLTGIITSLLAQGMEPFEAAQLGAYVHGSAGDLMTEIKSERGMIASDLLAGISQAWIELEDHEFF
ncbi:MAG: NAD(P)H-hydrate dehydratase [Planctomycetaceae bacterium]|nr:NAD(P)H-hydrate dehydratase [Planctomycetaceae bacterium]